MEPKIEDFPKDDHAPAVHVIRISDELKAFLSGNRKKIRGSTVWRLETYCETLGRIMGEAMADYVNESTERLRQTLKENKKENNVFRGDLLK